MIAPNLNPLCEEAEPYYYDLLFDEGCGSVPGFILDHVEQCQHCQEQINRLKDVESEVEDLAESKQGQASSAVTVVLKLHLAYIGKPVTCGITKPFLPGLSDPALELGMPTPITVHLDNCQQCSADLETIRRQNLTRKQLHRLSQLFAKEPAESSVTCSQAQSAILATVLMSFHDTNKEVLKHLCTCPDCRKSLYQCRETFRQEHLRDERDRKEFPCEEVSASDIFDYVIPYGLDPADDQCAKFRESLISHLRTCPTCLAKMQQLHGTVYDQEC